MNRRVVVTLSILGVVAASVVAPAAASGADQGGSAAPVSFAVIGDTPYGAEQVAAFPELIADINRHAGVRQVLHLGDIKTGSSVCADEYFEHIDAEFGRFLDPVIYTPGDNEWTDCHRAAAGGYDPHERLDTLRSVFFAEPGAALGTRPMTLATQADDPAHATFAENTRWVAAESALAMVHVVGSNNGLNPWFGGAETEEQTERREAEVEARTDAAVAWIDETFDVAEARGLRGVVIGMQADTFYGDGQSGFAEIVRTLADRARDFDGEVLLLQGDSHHYLVDRPLENGHDGYGITEPVPNLTRVIVEGETVSEWLRITIAPRSDDLFRWDRVQLD